MSSPGLALAATNARYWTGVAPLVRAQLERWERRALTIPDPALRTLALTKLRTEGFNAEVAATLATLAPRPRRALTVQAIVALQVLYDYLDGLTEQPTPDPLRDGRRLSTAFTDALEDTRACTGDAPGGASRSAGDYFRHHPSDDAGYLAELSAATSTALAGLPSWSTVAEIARASAAHCAEGQVRVHAAPRAGAAQLQEWARANAGGTTLGWREFMAGAVSSVLAVHALIAAAANDRTTPAEAAAIDSAYLSISALSTMLDSVIDYEQDSASGEAWYMDHYESHAALADRVVAVAREARRQTRTLPNAAHHEMTLVGVVAYYTSAPQAVRGSSAPVTRRVNEELGGLMTPTLAVMRAWRRAKTLRRVLTPKRRTAPATGASVEDPTVPLHQRLTVTGPT
jgi:tetraprenyl-beta-curcumene synthase